jgi:hypothetical protein
MMATAKFYCAAGYYYCYSKNNIAMSMNLHEKGLVAARSCGNLLRETMSLNNIAHVMWRTGQYTAAHKHAYDAERLARASGNLYEEAKSLQIPALCCEHCGDYKTSIAHSHRAREILGVCGMFGGSLDHQIMLTEASVHEQKTEYAEARHIYVNLVQKASAEDNLTGHALGILNTAGVDLKMGTNIHDVRNQLDTAKTMFQTLEYPGAVTHCEAMLATVKLRVRAIFVTSFLRLALRRFVTLMGIRESS